MDRLTSRFIHFETPEGALVEEPGTPAPEPVAAEPAAAEPVTEPAIPDWGSTLGDHVQQLAGGMNELYGLLEQQRQPEVPSNEPQAPEWDPLDPDSVRNFVRHEAQQLADQMYQERIGPYEHVLGSAAEEQGRQIAVGEFERIERDLGKFDHDQALLHTQSLITAGVEPLQAVEAAAQRQHAFEAQLKEQWAAEQQTHLNSLTDAPTELPVGQGGATELAPPPASPHEAAQHGGPSRYEQIANTVIERRRPLTAA
jgi:hypothetical protein